MLDKKFKEELIEIVKSLNKLKKNYMYKSNKNNTLTFLTGILETKEKEELLEVLYEKCFDFENETFLDLLFEESFENNDSLVYQCALESGLKREDSEIVDEIFTVCERRRVWLHNREHAMKQNEKYNLGEYFTHRINEERKWKEYLKDRREKRKQGRK